MKDLATIYLTNPSMKKKKCLKNFFKKSKPIRGNIPDTISKEDILKNGVLMQGDTSAFISESDKAKGLKVYISRLP